jgi:hypothetical protein
VPTRSILKAFLTRPHIVLHTFITINATLIHKITKCLVTRQAMHI